MTAIAQAVNLAASPRDGAVDAAINLGGPIDKSFEREVFARLPFGTERILGNDMSFDRNPSLDELSIAAYHLTRSQPSFFSSMVELAADNAVTLKLLDLCE